MTENICECGFGEEYFTIENEQSICTVCGGTVKGDAGVVLEEVERAGGKKVMVVDDQPFFRKRILEALTAKDYEVLEAGEGIEAIKLLAAAIKMSLSGHGRKIDIVILDLNMPGLIDGFQTLGILKAVEETLPVIILTSSPPTKELLTKLGQLKAKKYLNKASRDLEGLILRNLEAI